MVPKARRIRPTDLINAIAHPPVYPFIKETSVVRIKKKTQQVLFQKERKKQIFFLIKKLK